MSVSNGLHAVLKKSIQNEKNRHNQHTPLQCSGEALNLTGSTEFHLKSSGKPISTAEALPLVFRASGGLPVATVFHCNHTTSHRNPSVGTIFPTGRASLGKISPEGLPLTQNPNVYALPMNPPAGTLRVGVLHYVFIERPHDYTVIFQYQVNLFTILKLIVSPLLFDPAQWMTAVEDKVVAVPVLFKI